MTRVFLLLFLAAPALVLGSTIVLLVGLYGVTLLAEYAPGAFRRLLLLAHGLISEAIGR